MKLYSTMNLTILIWHYECLYFFSISLIKVKNILTWDKTYIQAKKIEESTIMALYPRWHFLPIFFLCLGGWRLRRMALLGLAHVYRVA